MKNIQSQIVNQTQLEVIFTAWGVCATIPSGKMAEIVCFPNREYAEISVYKKQKDSDCKPRLYIIKFFA